MAVRFTFNPQRDQLLKSLRDKSQKYSDTFPDAWAMSGKILKDLSKLNMENPGLELTCLAYRFWLMQVETMPPTLHHMGRWVNGMLLVDMQRLGEKPPSLAELVLSAEQLAWLEGDDDE